MKKVIGILAIAVIFFGGCKQKSYQEKYDEHMKRFGNNIYLQKSDNKEREKLFSGNISKDFGIIKLNPKNGSLISGKNVYKEFVNLLTKNKNVSVIEMTFVNRSNNYGDSRYTVNYNRVEMNFSIKCDKGGHNEWENKNPNIVDDKFVIDLCLSFTKNKYYDLGLN
jgi:hypothetical protein